MGDNVDSRNIPPLLAGMGPVAAADWSNSMTDTSPVNGEGVRHPSAPGAFLPCFLHDPVGNQMLAVCKINAYKAESNILK